MPDINYDQISLNSVSKASLNGGEWENDFFGNDLAFAHTTEEVNKKAHTTQPEPTDFEIYAQPTESETEGEETPGNGEGNNNAQEEGENNGETQGGEGGNTEGGNTPGEGGNP